MEIMETLTKTEQVKMWKTRVDKIQYTRNYDAFRVMPENRIVKAARVAKIKLSYAKVGYVPVPIIVNEKMEVIDGQGRLAACKELGLPVAYLVVPGLNAEVMRELNRWLVKWNLGDEISSYAASGSLPYIYLTQLIKANRGISLDVIHFAVHLKGASRQNISNGTFECTEEQYNEAIERLSYLKQNTSYIKEMPGPVVKMSEAVIFAYACPNIDNDKLSQRIESRYKFAKPFNSVDTAFDELSDIYNYRNRDATVHLRSLYKDTIKNLYGTTYATHRERTLKKHKTAEWRERDRLYKREQYGIATLE